MFQAGKTASEVLELEKCLSSLIKERNKVCSLGAPSSRGSLRCLSYLHSPWQGKLQKKSKTGGQVLGSNPDSALALTLGHFSLALFSLQQKSVGLDSNSGSQT